jgi:hypothetical protein
MADEPKKPLTKTQKRTTETTRGNIIDPATETIRQIAESFAGPLEELPNYRTLVSSISSIAMPAYVIAHSLKPDYLNLGQPSTRQRVADLDDELVDLRKKLEGLAAQLRESSQTVGAQKAKLEEYESTIRQYDNRAALQLPGSRPASWRADS